MFLRLFWRAPSIRSPGGWAIRSVLLRRRVYRKWYDRATWPREFTCSSSMTTPTYAASWPPCWRATAAPRSPKRRPAPRPGHVAAAASDSPVLVQGESGTGKELVARSIHLQSPRAARPFVSINCGALPDTLLESELFGHKKGAFSGAINSRVGLFEAANGGTLFLDEIGEMSPAMQVRLLRVLDSGEVRRVGEERVFHVDVRVGAAPARDLAHEAGDARFRWDLFYRVSTIVIPVPPLRRRRPDIPLLVEHFLVTHGRPGKTLRFSPDGMERLLDYGWPGNIRELRNLVERLHILHEGTEVRAADLPGEFGRVAAPSAPAAAASRSEEHTSELQSRVGL